MSDNSSILVLENNFLFKVKSKQCIHLIAKKFTSPLQLCLHQTESPSSSGWLLLAENILACVPNAWLEKTSPSATILRDKPVSTQIPTSRMRGLIRGLGVCKAFKIHRAWIWTLLKQNNWQMLKKQTCLTFTEKALSENFFWTLLVRENISFSYPLHQKR